MGKWILLHAIGALLAVIGMIAGTDVATGVTSGLGAGVMMAGTYIVGCAILGYMYQLSQPVPVYLPVKK